MKCLRTTTITIAPLKEVKIKTPSLMNDDANICNDNAQICGERKKGERSSPMPGKACRNVTCPNSPTPSPSMSVPVPVSVSMSMPMIVTVTLSIILATVMTVVISPLPATDRYLVQPDIAAFTSLPFHPCFFHGVL